jgi:hypothetical protein
MEAPSSNPRQSLLIHANIAPRTGPGLGYLGMTSVKAFGILIGAQGEGVGAQSAPRSGNSVIGTSGDQRWKPLNRTPNSTLMRQVHANLGWTGMKSLKCTPIWDGGRGEGVPEIAVIAAIARDRASSKKPKPSTTKDTKEREGNSRRNLWKGISGDRKARSPEPTCNRTSGREGCCGARSPGQSGENGSSGKAERRG